MEIALRSKEKKSAGNGLELTRRMWGGLPRTSFIAPPPAAPLPTVQWLGLS